MLYSIIIPCYRSSKTIRKVVELTMKELEAIGKTEYEFVLVDDCSPEGGETMAALIIPVCASSSLRRMQGSIMQ